MGASAQNITPEILSTLKQSYEGNAADRARQSVVSNGSFKKMAMRPEVNANGENTYFSIDIRSTGITDQQSSGRCWMFTGLNVLRNKAMKKMGNSGFQFSHIYLFFYDQLEKSNLFLQGIIDTRNEDLDSQKVQWLMQNPLSDGGTYTGVADLVSKYGLVPSEVQPETWASNNTSEIDGHLKRKLREIAINLREQAQAGKSEAELQAYKVEQLKTIYHMLVFAYGEPVQEFLWAPRDKNGKPLSELKKYTPMEFYKEYCAEAGDLQKDYIMLMNDPSRPYNKVYEIDMDRHVHEGHNWLYLNLDIKDLAPLAIASKLFMNKTYREAAEKAAALFAKRHLTMNGCYWGGTLDATCEDKEGSWAAFQGFLEMYERFKDEKYLVWAKHAMDVCLSYVVVWDIPLPAGRMADYNFKTTGWTVVSAQNQHIDVYGVLFAPEVYKMGKYLNDERLCRLAKVMYRTCYQLTDAYGSQGEQLQQTNFAQHGDMSNVYKLRGGYSESWTVFWITAHFLNAAARFEEMGVTP